jgi:tRNA(Ile)-lysidine synthase
MLDRIARFIERHGMFEPGMRIGVAVSGGADSVAALTVLAALAPAQGWRLTVLHANHQLRGADSAADEGFVRAAAAALGLPCECAALPVPPGGNLEQAARDLRRAFFRRFLETGALDRVATGHTLTDQAETVLFRLVRGSGLPGLAAMRPLAAGIARPLLEIERAEVRGWLLARGVAWREDASNEDLRFARNRIRHELLPALREENPRVELALGHLATLAQEEEDYWAHEVARALALASSRQPYGLILDAGALGSMPTALARRVVRGAIEQVKGDLRQLDFPHVEQVLALAGSAEGEGEAELPGVKIERSFEWLRFRTSEDRPVPELPVPGPGAYASPEPGKVIVLEVDESTIESSGEGFCDRVRASELFARGLVLRGWRPGDRYRPAGHGEETKLKVLFHRARVPLWERPSWPMLVTGDKIVWAKQFGAAAEFAAGPGDEPRLRISERESAAG